MEVKEGYKQTEVGVIPENWLDPQLQEITEDNAPICYGIVKLGAFTPNGVPVLVIRDLNQDYISDIYRSSHEIEHAYTRSRVRPYDVLISVKGTTGRVGIVPAHFRGNISRDLARIRTRKDVDPKFVFQMLQSDLAKHRLTVATVGTTRMELSIAILKQVRIPLPPTKAEQEAIAEALSDADALIQALEQLIAKKRQVKQGAMQELLTGKRRLPGYSGEWVTREIGDLGLDISDGNYSSMYPKQSDFKEMGVPFIRANNISKMKVIDDDMRFISADQHNVLLKGHLKKDDILITTRGELGNIALVPDRHIGSNINAQIVRINTRQLINHIYLAFFLSHDDVQKRIKGAETGSALKQLPVGKLIKIPVALPTLPEQTAIAEILSDMDAEIAALEAKLAKARQVKQGMMQELLTGRIRLI